MNLRIAGVLFILATAAPILTTVFVGFLGGSIAGVTNPEYIHIMAVSEKQVMITVMIELVWALSVIGIPIMLFAKLKEYDLNLALGFFSLRFVEGICTLMGTVALLLLLSLSQNTAGQDPLFLTGVGDLLLSVRKWTFLIGPGVFWSLSPLILNYVLYQTRWVPAWLSIWGLVGALVSLLVYLLMFFGFENLDALFIPIAVQEIVFAVWLITKGFIPAPLNSNQTR